MRALLLVSGFVSAIVLSVEAQSPPRTAVLGAATTFAKDIAPIFYANCIACHRPGEVAPMSLRTYDEVRPWARSIRQKVSTRQMPPWFADPAHGSFANDARLNQQQIDTIVKWVDAGAPQGNPADTPQVPTYSDGWQLGEPDYVITLPRIEIPAEGKDIFPTPNLTMTFPRTAGSGRSRSVQARAK